MLRAIKDVLGKSRDVETVEVDVSQRLVTVSYRDGTGAEEEMRERLTEARHTVG